MEYNNDDEVILFERHYQKQSFLRKKISLTVPICVLLIVVFLSSIFIVSIISFYWTEGIVCHINNNESRPKRSLTSKKVNLPCLNAECCTTPLDPNAPWNQSRLPTNIYPIDYQLALEFHYLNQNNDQYNGTVDIVIEVQSPTNDIILHGVLLYSDFSVSQRSSSNNIPLTIDCVILFSDTQTVTIHLIEQLQIGYVYDVRISFFRALNIHGIGIFENQFNKDLFGSECVMKLFSLFICFIFFSKSRIILTHFKPVYAREAFPCFDEPNFKAKFQLTVSHENNTRILSNWDESVRK
jgi:hypothetical protein